MGISIEDKLRESLAGLEAGDGIRIPVVGNRSESFRVSVLRCEGEGENKLFFLSFPTRGFWNDQLDEMNPLRFDESLCALADKKGNVPGWYSFGIYVEKGAALAAAERYALVPRLDNDTLSADNELLDKASKCSLQRLVEGIFQNGESGNFDNQIYLFFKKEIGWTPDVEQLTKLTIFYDILVSLGMLSISYADIDEMANESSDSGGEHSQFGDWQDEYNHGQPIRVH